MLSEALSSSETFIRSLKSSSDPPFENGPRKIELAAEAYAKVSLYIPAKREIIADWILSTFFKERKSDKLSNPCWDARYWALLSSVITNNEQPSSSKATSLWLDPLLLRYPFLSLVASVMGHASSASEDLLVACHATLRDVFALSNVKFAHESAWELFTATLSSVPSLGVTEDYWLIRHPGQMLTGTALEVCQSIFADSTNKRKTSSLFFSDAIRSWIVAQSSLLSITPLHSLSSRLSEIASSIMFSVDTLRQQIPLWIGTPGKSHLDQLFSPGTDPIQTLRVLPTIFRSFSHEVQRHRATALPSPSGTGKDNQHSMSSKARAKRTCMQFLDSCMKSIAAHRSDKNLLHEVWLAKGKLLKVIEEESLLQSDDIEGQRTLGELSNQAAEILGQQDSSDITFLSALFEVVTSLIRLDYSLVAPSLPIIFNALCLVPHGSLQNDFLFLHLSFHTKTRTLRDVISLLCDTLSGVTFLESDSRKTLLRSNVLGRDYLGRLGSAIASFLTPSQVLPTVELVIGALESLWTALTTLIVANDSLSKSKAKQRRASDEVSIAEVRLAALSALASAVLRSLPLRSVPKDARIDIVRRVTSLRETVLLPAIDGMLLATTGMVKEKKVLELQYSGTTMLRLMGDLQGSLLWQSLNVEVNENQEGLIARAAQTSEVLAGDILPELRVELVRTILQHFSPLDVSVPLLVPSDGVFDIIHKGLISPLGNESFSARSISTGGWDGFLSSLDPTPKGAGDSVLATWQLVLRRWLVVVDSFAPEKFLRLVAETLIVHASHSISSSIAQTGMETGGDITLASLCQQAIRSAELWEMPKLRMVILSHITQKCNPLKEVPLEKVISSPLPNAIVSEEQVASAIHALHFVLRVPPEYLDKATRAGVGHTALICDIFRCRHVDAAGKAKAIEDSVALRTLLCRLAEEFSNIEALITNASIITHLSTPLAQISSSNPNPKEAVSPSSTAASAQGLQAISLKLLELAYSSTVDSFKQDGDVTLLRHILGHSHQVLSSGLVLKTKERKSFSFGFESRAAMVLLSSLAGALQTSSNSVDISEECRQLFQLLQGQVNSGLATLSSNPDSVAPETSIAVIVAAEKLLRVESWLGEPPLHAGAASWLKALVGILRTNSPAELPTAVLGLVLESANSLKAQGSSLLAQDFEETLAMVVVTMESLDATAWPSAYPALARFSRSTSLEAYTLAQSSIHALVQRLGYTNNGNNDHTQQSVLLLHISSIFLRNPPEGSFKINLEYITHLLSMISRLKVTENPEILSCALMVVLDIVGDKSASLRHADLGVIYTILGLAVSGSPNHISSKTTDVIYETIISILLALARLRRDLAASTLPHFAFLSKRLFEILRAVRPELGARQRRAVTDTLPFWINPSEPLGAGSAKLLARLLTNLQAKTIVRSGPSASVQSQGQGRGQGGADPGAVRAQSLAQPFSKHAPHVATAYIRALIDPLSTMSQAIRQELEPGLFALCEIMGEYGRDAIMTAMLDDSGKAMMRLLWVQYDKQRYVGKG